MHSENYKKVLVMPGKIFDTNYVEHFKKDFVAHLQKEPVHPGPQNQARDIIEIAKSNSGKLSRLFDTFEPPIVDKASFMKGLEEAGSIGAYMRPILNELSSVLLTKDKMRLSDDVIQAIGIDNYANIVKGTVDSNGMVIPKKGEEEQFAQNEANAARLVLASILTNYSLRVMDYNLSEEDIICQKKCEELFQVSSRLKKSLPNELQEHLNKDIPSVPFDVKEADKIIQAANTALLQEDNNEDKVKLYKQCVALRTAGMDIVNKQSQDFVNQVIAPLDNMANNFSMDLLNEPAPKQSLKEVKEKVAALSKIVEAALEDLQSEAKKYRDENGIAEKDQIPQLDNPLKSVKWLRDKLAEANDIEELFTEAADDTKRDKIEKIYNNAVEKFKEAVNTEITPVKPPAPLMNIIFRIIRAIFTWSLTSRAEREDQKRFELESKLQEPEANLYKKVTEFKGQVEQLKNEGKAAQKEVGTPQQDLQNDDTQEQGTKLSSP